jgi:mitogen-activated protein kinase 1/3
MSTIVHSNPIPAKEKPLAAPLKGRPISDDSSKSTWEKEQFPGTIPRVSQSAQGLEAGAFLLVCTTLVLVLAPPLIY